LERRLLDGPGGVLDPHLAQGTARGSFGLFNTLAATDISDSAIARASRGFYPKAEIARGMPTALLDRYFICEDGGYRIRDELRAFSSFKRWNLFEDFSAFGRFDVVFCRNVAIYFADEDKRRLFERLERALEMDGSLIVGATESLLGSTDCLEARRYLRAVYYQRRAGARTLRQAAGAEQVLMDIKR